MKLFIRLMVLITALFLIVGLLFAPLILVVVYDNPWLFLLFFMSWFPAIVVLEIWGRLEGLILWRRFFNLRKTNKMEIQEILKKYESGDISFDKAFEELSKTGACPILLNDDDGRWAVTFEGFQYVVCGEAEVVHTSFFVEKDSWKNTISEALIYTLKT